MRRILMVLVVPTVLSSPVLASGRGQGGCVIHDLNAAALASAAASAEGSATAKRPEKALRNDDILSLVKVGLDDNLIISKIQAAEATNFDLSTEGIVALKTAKVSNAVIDAMMKRAGK